MPASKLNAEHYYSNSSTQKRLADDILYLHDFTGNENILDIGCGDGIISAKLATIAYNGKVTGIDPSKEMIAFTQQNISTQPNLFFENIPAENFFSN